MKNDIIRRVNEKGNSMQRTTLLCLVGVLIAGVISAEDFWVKKEYMQWTDEEVKKVLTNSPWAKDITINAPLSAIYGRGQAPVAQSASEESGGGGGGRGRRGGGGGGGAAPAEGILTLNISWRSALPMRKALVRSRLDAGAAVPPEAQQMLSRDEGAYVIVVTGVPMALANAAQASAASSTIRAGKKDPVAAGGVDLQKRTQSADVIYAFPKMPVTADDKEIEVVLKFGQVEAKKKFNLKDMVYNGKLEL